MRSKTERVLVSLISKGSNVTPEVLLREVEYAVRQAGRKGIAAREIAGKLGVERPIVNTVLGALQAAGKVRSGTDWMYYPARRR